MYITNVDEKQEFKALTKEGAFKVKVKYLIHRNAGAQNFWLRYYVIDPGGYTPQDCHIPEHEVYVLQGKGKLLHAQGERDLKSGDAIYIGSNEFHQLRNPNDDPFIFLCVRGAEMIYGLEKAKA